MNRVFNVVISSPGNAFRRNLEVVAPTARKAIDRAERAGNKFVGRRTTWLVESLTHRGKAV